MYPNEYYNRVKKLAKVKYEIEEEVIEAFYDEIVLCSKRGYTPRRTVEYLTKQIF